MDYKRPKFAYRPKKTTDNEEHDDEPDAPSIPLIIKSSKWADAE
jgi:hypothetical protein